MAGSYTTQKQRIRGSNLDLHAVTYTLTIFFFKFMEELIKNCWAPPTPPIKIVMTFHRENPIETDGHSKDRCTFSWSKHKQALQGKWLTSRLSNFENYHKTWKLNIFSSRIFQGLGMSSLVIIGQTSYFL